MYYLNAQNKLMTLIQNEQNQICYTIAGNLGRPQATLYLYDQNNNCIASLTQSDTDGLFQLNYQQQTWMIHLYSRYNEHIITIPKNHDWGYSSNHAQTGHFFHYQHLLLKVKLANKKVPEVYQINLQTDCPVYFLLVRLMFTADTITKPLPKHYPWKIPSPNFVRYYKER